MLQILDVLQFATEAHKHQRRKYDQAPYVNHLIEVAHLISNIGNITDIEILAAALLHDILEDTETSEVELSRRFGSTVTDMVIALTDDKSLSLAERREKQLQELPSKPKSIKIIKLADHCSNIAATPEDWSEDRVTEYMDWSWKVSSVCFGANADLAKEYQRRFRKTKEEKYKC